jgi:site-specific recombinase XerD
LIQYGSNPLESEVCIVSNGAVVRKTRTWFYSIGRGWGQAVPRRKLIKRADGRYEIKVFLGRDDGKRRYKSLYGLTQEDVERQESLLLLSIGKGLDVTSDRDTFGDWADRWLKIKAAEVSAGRLVTYKCCLKHLNAKLEAIQISKVRTAHIQDVILDLAAKNPNTRKPTAKKTLFGIKSAADQIFQLAIDNRVLDYNPATAVKVPQKAPQTKRRALTEAEKTWILDPMIGKDGKPHRAHRAAMIMMFAGPRRGETIPFLWTDFDPVARTLRIEKAVEVLNNRMVVKSMGKNEYSTRTVDLPQILVDFLENEPRDSIFICSNANGEMHTETSWRRMWDSYLTELNLKYGDFSPFEKRPQSKFDPAGAPFIIPRITPHWLRHTFATMLYLAGVDILTAKEQLGHADIKTTLEIYTHLDAQYKRKSMDKLDLYLDPSLSKGTTKRQG